MSTRQIFPSAKIFRKNQAVVDIADAIRKFSNSIYGFSPHIYHSNFMNNSVANINVYCPTLMDIRRLVSLFRILCNILPQKNLLNIAVDIESVCNRKSSVIFGCRVSLGRSIDFLNESIEEFSLEFIIQSYEGHIDPDCVPEFLAPTFESNISSEEFLRKYSYEKINSSNLSVLAEVVFNEIGTVFLSENVRTGLIGGLQEIELDTIGKVGDLISGESRELFKKYATGFSPIPTIPASIFLFSLAIKHPHSACWPSIFPRTFERPILMSHSFAIGLANKHGDQNFRHFADTNNFQVIN